jgi:hypothetical protein
MRTKGGFKVMGATVLSASLLVASAAQAMDIIQFDRMTSQDRQAFLLIA